MKKLRYKAVYGKQLYNGEAPLLDKVLLLDTDVDITPLEVSNMVESIGDDLEYELFIWNNKHEHWVLCADLEINWKPLKIHEILAKTKALSDFYVES